MEEIVSELFCCHLLYKDEKPSVCLSVCLHFWCHTANSVILAWIHLRLGLSDSYGLWHKQVCFYKFLRPLSWAQECFKEAAVVQFRFHFASRKFAKLCNFAPAKSTVSYYGSKESAFNGESIRYYWYIYIYIYNVCVCLKSEFAKLFSQSFVSLDSPNFSTTKLFCYMVFHLATQPTSPN